MEDETGVKLEQEQWLAYWSQKPLRPPTWRDNDVVKPTVRYRYPGGYRIGAKSWLVVINKEAS